MSHSSSYLGWDSVGGKSGQSSQVCDLDCTNLQTELSRDKGTQFVSWWEIDGSLLKLDQKLLLELSLLQKLLLLKQRFVVHGGLCVGLFVDQHHLVLLFAHLDAVVEIS